MKPLKNWEYKPLTLMELAMALKREMEKCIPNRNTNRTVKIGELKLIKIRYRVLKLLKVVLE